MSTIHTLRVSLLLLIALLMTGCSSSQKTTTAAESPRPTPTIIRSAAATDALVASLTPGDDMSDVNIEDDLVHLWAETGVLSPFEIPDIATGSPDSKPGCGSEQLTSIEEPGSEVYLTLNYGQPLIPSAVTLFMSELTDGIERVEILNTATGLGRELFNKNDTPIETTPLGGKDCIVSLSLPVEVDFEVNTVIIGFSRMTAAATLDAVELAGSPVVYEEPLIYWRVPLPYPPVSLAVDALNQVYLSTESNQIIKYDIEGNLLEELAAPTSGTISDMAIDAYGNLVLNDGDFGEYVILSADGEIARGGGDAPTVQVAIGPGQENVYMLGDLGGLYYLLSYLPGTYEIINPLPLDGTSYSGMVFSAENKLYTMRDEDGFLVEIDPLTGLEVNSIPLKAYDQRGVLPQDLAIDPGGNFYVLFASNTDGAALKVYDPRGFYVRSIGRLIDQPQAEWPEGSYHAPRAIALTHDARFALLIDGIDRTGYLTCLLLMTE